MSHRKHVRLASSCVFLRICLKHVWDIDNVPVLCVLSGSRKILSFLSKLVFFALCFGVKSGEGLIHLNGVYMLDSYLTVTNFISDIYL